MATYDELVERIAALETVETPPLVLKDLPIQAIKDELATGWTPDPVSLLTPSSITRELLAIDAIYTTLPTTIDGAPIRDGQEITYLADSTNGITWKLKYRTAETTYKWHAVGATELWAGTHLDEQIAAATITYVALATAVQVTVPLTGEYYISHGFRGYPWAVVQDLYASAQGCGLTAADNDGAFSNASIAAEGSSGFRTVKKTLTSTGTLAQQYRHSLNTAAANFSRRTLTVKPIRVI